MCKQYDENDNPIKYQASSLEFDVPAWLGLCKGFLEYVRDLDLAQEDTHLNRGSGLDEYVLRGLDNIESQGSELVRIAKYLIDIRPPEENLYISSIVLGDIGREHDKKEEE